MANSIHELNAVECDGFRSAFTEITAANEVVSVGDTSLNILKAAIIPVALIDASSPHLIPLGAKILRVKLDVTTPYSAGAKMQVGVVGAVDCLVADTKFTLTTPAHIEVEKINFTWVADAVVLVTITGSPAVGASTVIVEYI